MNEVCAGCGHVLGQHFQSVDGKVRCLQTESGMSTGVIMPYTICCDCVDYQSEVADRRREENKRKNEEWDRHMEELGAAIREKLGKSSK